MKSKWEFSLYKVTILFFAGMILGAEISLLTTNNVSLRGGMLEIIAMISVSIAVLISCRKKETE